MKTKITMIVLLLIGSCSFAQVNTIFTSGGINYKITSATTVEVGSNSSASGAVTIPPTVTHGTVNYQVTSIIHRGFSQAYGLTSLVLPNSITSIGSHAFIECTSLTSFTIPTGVTSIEDNTFHGCTSLTSINIHDDVSFIGHRAFFGCSSLTAVSIPNLIVAIEPLTFGNCTSLTSVTLPNSLVSIRGAAFMNCGALSSINIPVSVSVIGSGAFEYCISLSSFTVPNAVTRIEESTFNSCTNLTSINIHDAVTFIGSFAFSDCTALTTVTLPTSLSIIEYGAFQYCDSLTGITIPNSVQSIGNYAFSNCTSLTSVTVDWPSPLSVTRDVFANIVLPNVLLNGPTGTSALYDAAPVWTEFGSILPLYTAIPDNNFEQALFDKGIDTVLGDNRVLTAAVINIPALDVSNKGITDLTGIEAFAALTDLNCEGNQLNSLNIAAVVMLEKLNCNKNQITSLDLRSQTMLRELRCEGNLLTTINITGISSLEQVYCANNLLTSVNFSRQINLRQLYCNNNQLITINIKNQEPTLNNFNCENNLLNNMDLRGFYVLADFNCTLNPNLNCITVDDVAFANANFLKDATANFSTNCYAPLVLNYCVGTPAAGLASPYAANVATRWYTVAVGGRFSTTAPTPSTNTVATRIFYVSQVLGGIESARTAITVNTVAVPAAPVSITGIAAPSIFVGTTTTVAYAVAPVANATSYNWTVPTGVNIVSGQGTRTLTVNFSNVSVGAGIIGNLMVVAVNSLGCGYKATRNLLLTKALPTAPTAIRLTDAGVVTTSIAKYLGQPTVLTLTANPVVGVNTYEWELPAGVNVLSGALPVRGGALGGNIITVNFEGVTTAAMFNYTTTTGILTHVLRIGVRSINGVGSSTTSNAGLVNPTTNNTARLLTLTAVAPRASSSIRMTDAMASDPTRAITVMSTFIGTPKTLTLTATAVATANEYNWELPAGVKQLSGGNSNTITVNFADVAAGTTSLYLGAKAVNGAGVSVTSNASLVPATNSTARLLRLSATVPGTVPAVTGQVTGLCGKNFYTYTISPSALATSYQITAPAGAIVTSKSKELNKSNVINTSDLEFVVNYPEKFAATREIPASITVAAVNGVGTSATLRTIVVTTTVPTPTPEDIIIEIQKARFNGPKTKIARRFKEPIFGRSKVFEKLVVVVNDGAEIVAEDSKEDVIEVDFSKVPTTVKSTKVFIYNENSCGVLSLPMVRIINLELIANNTTETLTIEATEIYPNPVVDDLSIDVTASKVGTLDIAIYSLEGIQVADSKTFTLKEGANTITENVSNLAKGIYIVQLLNSSNNEVITKKLIKN